MFCFKYFQNTSKDPDSCSQKYFKKPTFKGISKSPKKSNFKDKTADGYLYCKKNNILRHI